MGIIDDYLKPEDDNKPVATVNDSGSADSVISRFLNDPDKPVTHITVRPNPPISGVSKEQSDIINSQLPDTKGGANPRSVLDIPVNAGKAVGKAFMEGVGEIGGGASDVLSNKPASGIGRAGMGVLSALTSPLKGVNRVVSDITGSKDIGDRAELVAGAIPIIKVGEAAKSALPSNQALSTLVDKITSNGRDPQALKDVVSAMKADPRVGPADLSPAVLNMAQKLFVTEGDAAKNYLYNASKNRIATSKDAVEGAFDAAGGTPVNVVSKLNDLAEASKKVGSDQINPAIKSAKPVNVTATIDAIDAILKPGVMSKISGESGLPLSNVKKELAQIKAHLTNGKEMRTDAEDLHKFQSGLRRTGESLLRSADGGSRELGNALLNVRRNLVNDIDASTGGKYKPALSNYRDEMHIADAFRDSYNGVFTNSKKMENRPEFTKQWFDGLSDYEKEAAREGARLAIDTQINIAKNGQLAGTNLGKSDFNQKRLEILFGKENTDKLLQKLEHERAIANTHNKIVEGSQTEMRRAGDAAIALPEVKQGGDVSKFALPAAAEGALYYMTGGSAPGAGFASTLALSKGASYAKHKIATKLAKERNFSLAKMTIPSNEAERQTLINSLDAIANKPPKQSLLRRSSNALTQVIKP